MIAGILYNSLYFCRSHTDVDLPHFGEMRKNGTEKVPLEETVSSAVATKSVDPKFESLHLPSLWEFEHLKPEFSMVLREIRLLVRSSSPLPRSTPRMKRARQFPSGKRLQVFFKLLIV